MGVLIYPGCEAYDLIVCSSNLLIYTGDVQIERCHDNVSRIDVKYTGDVHI